jgi:hypothetical protein
LGKKLIKEGINDYKEFIMPMIDEFGLGDEPLGTIYNKNLNC